MPDKKLFLVIIFLCWISCGKNSGPDTGGENNHYVSVLTQRNNNTRSGYNDKETILTTSNVNAQQFKKLFSLSVDDQVYAQPLIAANVTILRKKHNIAYIATVLTTVIAGSFIGKKTIRNKTCGHLKIQI